MKLTRKKRDELRMKFGGCCAFCGSELPARGWHAEYVGDEYVAGGLAPICTECRTAKGVATTEAFRVILAEQVRRAHRHSVNFRMAIRFGLIVETDEPVIFWFEKYGTGRYFVEQQRRMAT